MIPINFVNKGKYMLVHGPRPISEAKKDGTKYIVWDKYLNEWIVASSFTIAMSPNTETWLNELTGEIVHPTHFVEYFPDPNGEE